MRTLTVVVLAGLSLLGGLSPRTSSHAPSAPIGACTDAGGGMVVRHGRETLELAGPSARVTDAWTGATRDVPIDQVLVDTELGPMAVLDDDAVPLTGACEQAAARLALAE